MGKLRNVFNLIIFKMSHSRVLAKEHLKVMAGNGGEFHSLDTLKELKIDQDCLFLTIHKMFYSKTFSCIIRLTGHLPQVASKA